MEMYHFGSNDDWITEPFYIAAHCLEAVSSNDQNILTLFSLQSADNSTRHPINLYKDQMPKQFLQPPLTV